MADSRKKKRRRSRSSAPATLEETAGPLSARLVRCVDLLLIATMVVVPFMMGGRQPLGQLLLVLLSCGCALTWSLSQLVSRRPQWRWTGAEPLLLLAVGLLTLQVVTLPENFLHQLSPAFAERLPQWSSAESTFFPSWQTVSLTPAVTLTNLATVLSCVLLFWVVAQRVRVHDDCVRLVRWLAYTSVAMALFGIAQYLLGNGKFFWVYDYPYTDTLSSAKGAFTNANHFASFLAMGIPMLLWLFAREAQPARRSSSSSTPSRGWPSIGSNGSPESFDQLLAMVGLGAIGLGILLSQSRGGLVVGCVGLVVTMLLLYRLSLLSGKLAGGVCLTGVVAISMLTFFGERADRLIEQNFQELTSGDVATLDHENSRREIWEADARGVQEFPILGTGLGSHRWVYRMYFDQPYSGIEYTHAESGYLQVALETGFVGLGIVLMLILLTMIWCARGMWNNPSADSAGLLAVVVAVMAVNLVHSITDFVWYAPGCMVPIVILAAIAARSVSIRREESGGAQRESLMGIGLLSRRIVWGGMTLACVALAAGMTLEKLPSVQAHDAQMQYITLNRMDTDEVDDSVKDHWVNQRLLAAIEAARLQPRSSRLQARAAAAYLQMFRIDREKADSGLTLDLIKDTARTGGFESQDQLNTWLNKPAVMGESREFLNAALVHARRSLRLCPLEGTAYWILSDVGFLDGTTPEDEMQLVEQALLARPYSARSHYEAGQRLWSRGEVDEAFEHWKFAFHRDRRYQKRMIRLLANLMPAEEMMETFEPDVEALTRMRDAYRESPDQEGYRMILTHLAEQWARDAFQAEGRDAVVLWKIAFDAFEELGDGDRADKCAHAGVDASPNTYLARYTLANWLYSQQRYEEALEHLQWCSRRKPDHKDLKIRVERALAESHRQRDFAPLKQADGRDANTMTR